MIGFAGPIEAFRGLDRVPTGFDPVNGGSCTFTSPITKIRVDLLREGQLVFQQEITLDPPSEVVPFPLSEELVEVVPADIEPGPYDRRILVNSAQGETAEMVSDTIWVFDSSSHPVTAARHALARMLGVNPDVTFLLTYEPVTWADASLGCQNPDSGYAEVETPGFKLVFNINTPDLWGPLYEYHTNLDGSMIARCEEPAEQGPTTESPIAFVMEDSYELGQDIEIKIRNSGTSSYVYSEYYPACVNLEFYDGSQEAHRFERFSEMEGSYFVEMHPGLFVIPEGTHCDIANESQIEPGEEVVLLTWRQEECIKDSWGCVEKVPVKAGRYTILGKFPESKGSSDPNALSYEKGDETVAEWDFTIASP